MRLPRILSAVLPESWWQDFQPENPARLGVLIALAITVFLCPISITRSEFALAITVLLVLWRGRRPDLHPISPRPAMLIPLAGFMLWSIFSALASQDPVVSLINLKKLVLFALVPLFLLLLDRPAQAWTFYPPLFLATGLSAVAGIVQFLEGMEGPLNRAHGFMGHHMTFAGQLSLILLAMAAFPLLRNNWKSIRFRIFSVIGLLILVALLATLTRNAWLGFASGMLVIALLVRPRLAILIPVGIVLIFLVSPAVVKDRFYHFFDIREAGNAARINMMTTGLHIVEDRPLFGVGPKMIERDVYKYGAAPRIQPAFIMHLHNNVIQLAAERGLPALGFWLWFMGACLVTNFRFYRYLKEIGERCFLFYPVSAMAVTIALFVSGMFEFNFGDSEVLILFLTLLSLPAVVQMHRMGARDHAPT